MKSTTVKSFTIYYSVIHENIGDELRLSRKPNALLVIDVGTVSIVIVRINIVKNICQFFLKVSIF